MNRDNQEHSLTAVYQSHNHAEQAIKDLRREGLNMKRISLVGRDVYAEGGLHSYTSGDHAKRRGGHSAFWGSLRGLLFGGSFFTLPSLGPVVAMGPLVGWIASALTGNATQKAGILAAALGGLGLPDESLAEYEANVKAGNFLVLTRENSDTIARAYTSLQATNALGLKTHQVNEPAEQHHNDPMR